MKLLYKKNKNNLGHAWDYQKISIVVVKGTGSSHKPVDD